jgi:hypothetical protein
VKTTALLGYEKAKVLLNADTAVTDAKVKVGLDFILSNDRVALEA